MLPSHTKIIPSMINQFNSVNERHVSPRYVSSIHEKNKARRKNDCFSDVQNIKLLQYTINEFCKGKNSKNNGRNIKNTKLLNKSLKFINPEVTVNFLNNKENVKVIKKINNCQSTTNCKRFQSKNYFYLKQVNNNQFCKIKKVKLAQNFYVKDKSKVHYFTHLKNAFQTVGKSKFPSSQSNKNIINANPKIINASDLKFSINSGIFASNITSK